MSWIDWLILFSFFVYIIWDGTRHSRMTTSVEDLLLARRKMSWLAIGISVMATQASAITFIGTTGLAFQHDMRFLQLYLGLPVAMVVLSVTLVPFFYHAKVFTAYEVLEKKFGLRVRLTTSALFLISRGLAMGTIIAAPAYVLSLILNVPLSLTIIIIGLSATVYTVFGGITGVIRTDIKQMVIMMFGLAFCFYWIVHRYPEGIGFGEGLKVAGAVGKLQILDISFDMSERYNIWSGLIAAFFLFLSYFGCDQSQVQRYLTAKSLNDARSSLMVSAFLKIPMMFLVLLLGAMLYVFYIFYEHPVLFIPDSGAAINEQMVEEFSEKHRIRSERAYDFLNDANDGIGRYELDAADFEVNQLRHLQAMALRKTNGMLRNDTNYIFPYFILNEIPRGILGLIIAAIFAAALSSIDSGLNSLAASSIMDWYVRMKKRSTEPGKELRITRTATAFWGIFATLTALALGETESIIELVNQIGSYFYGSILGVFILLFLPGIKAKSVIPALAFGIFTVLVADSLYIDTESSEYFLNFPYLVDPAVIQNHSALRKAIGFLWLNPIGALAVLIFSVIISGIRNVLAFKH